jgi:hypothetical protein
LPVIDMKIAALFFAVTLLLASSARSQTTANPSPLALQAGDHIALVGNALADRMQHSGHFETLLHAQFPQHRLVVRNLAASGDEVVIRHRSENFGTPDDWLTRVRADVIIGFFGFNESFRGPAGLEGFKADLDRWIKETRTKSYTGRGAPRIALVSPIAAERHQDPNYEDPAPLNVNLALYTDAMAAVARDNNVPFVDAFKPSQGLFAAAAQEKRSLTINGFHLSDEGDRQLAPVLFRGLLGIAPPSGNHDKLRAAINEKSSQWHQRYRTIDGYNVYGGRSALAYQPGKGPFISDRNAASPYISNYKVMQEEMSQRDVLTANRDLRIWAVAGGGDHVIDDSNLPPVTQVPSNKPGEKDDGSHVFLGGEQAIAKMTVHSGMKVNLFADEKQFPELVSPVQMAWDTRAASGSPRGPTTPSALRPARTATNSSCSRTLERRRQGRQSHHLPRRSELPHRLPVLQGRRHRDAGSRRLVRPRHQRRRQSRLEGTRPHGPRFRGLPPHRQCHLPRPRRRDLSQRRRLPSHPDRDRLRPVRNNDGPSTAFEPRTVRFETYIPYGFANPHGRVFDRWGNDLVTDATGNNTYFGPAFSGASTTRRSTPA